MIHPTAVVEDPDSIPESTNVWHFCHVMRGTRIGKNVSLGQNCFVADGVSIGDGSRIQNNVSLYQGVELEEDVFVGPSAVFTNVTNPRASVNRKSEYRRTLVRRGATVGANATVLPGVTLGAWSFVAAGAVVTHDVADFELVAGVPARRAGWVSRHGERLELDAGGRATCPTTGERYVLVNGSLRPDE